MNLLLSIACTECYETVVVPIMNDGKENYCLSESIEDMQEGFYCSVDQPNSMKVNCSCGNDVRVYF